MGHVVDSGGEMPEKRCRVPSYTLESILATVDHRLNRICIKIDVEGHERRVLCSVSTEALKRVNSVIVEVHLYKFSEPGKELERICGVLSAVGAPRFIVLDRKLHPGYRRLWWHATKRYPVLQLPVPAVLRLVKAHSVPELYVLAEREGYGDRLSSSPCDYSDCFCVWIAECRAFVF